MINIKVLGTGCANCKTTLKLIEDIAAEKKVAIQLEKVEDIQAIMAYGVMSTPGVVMDGKVVHAGGIPAREKIQQWLSSDTATTPTEKSGGCCSGGKCC
jgi:small redox-active disulfide protein 2